MNQYSINILWSDEDECFVATILEFPNLSAFGETYEEAISDAQEVLEMALASLESDGIPAPQPNKCPSLFRQYSGQIRLRIPKSLHGKLTENAENEGVSLNTYMVSLLSENNATNTISRKIDSRFDEFVKHQDQHFMTLHREIDKQPNGNFEKHSEYQASRSQGAWSAHRAFSKEKNITPLH